MRAPKPSNIAGVACSMIGALNDMVKGTPLLDDQFSLREYGTKAFGQFSDYFPMPEKADNKQLLCTGMDYR